MSTGTTVGSAPAQDPEDVFELPTFYHGLAPLQRTRQPSAEALIYDARAHEIRNFRGLRAVDCEALIADGVRASRYAQGKVLTDVGVTAHRKLRSSPSEYSSNTVSASNSCWICFRSNG